MEASRNLNGSTHVVLGYTAAALETVRFLVSQGCEVVIVAPHQPEDLPEGVRVVAGDPQDPEVQREVGREMVRLMLGESGSGKGGRP